MTPDQIIDFIRRRRFTVSSEKELQFEVENELIAANLPFERERRLGPGDIVDFFFPGGAALEFKIKGQPRSHFSQVERYCGYECVTSIILATNVAMGLPPEIRGKPAYFVSLGRAWL